MKKIFVLFLMFSSLSCTSQNKNKMLLEEEIGFIGDTANFTKEVLFLEDLSKFSDTLMLLNNEQDNTVLIDFYNKTIGLIQSKSDSSDFLIELIGLCEDGIYDIKTRQEYKFSDMFLLWNDLRLFYSSALKYKELNDDNLVTLSEKEYSKLIIYESDLLSEARKDDGYDLIFAYSFLGKENGKTKIAFYKLIY